MTEPVAKLVPLQVSGKGEGFKSRIAVRSHTLVLDERKEHGGKDEGPNPMETLLSSFAGCTNVIINRIAQHRGFDVRDISVDVLGKLDLRGILAVEKISTPFPQLFLTVGLRTSSSPADIESLKEELRWRCPASVILRGTGAVVTEHWNVEYEKKQAVG